MDLAANLSSIRQRISDACARAGRTPESVTLLPVTKTQPPDVIEQAAALGLTCLGENKVQEALLKMDQTSDLSVRWHLIGHLQSNKAKKAARFDLVHSVDTPALVQKLARRVDADRAEIPFDAGHDALGAHQGEHVARRV